MAELTLILGGARSGKSRRAEALVCAQPAPRVYIATAQAWDVEMEARIAQHRADRAGMGWTTLEAPLDLPGALAQAAPGAVVLIDCLTLWVSNHLLAGSDMAASEDALASSLAARAGSVIAVANETGLGIVPDNALARAFRDAAGRLNQRLAAQATRVEFVVAGLPMVIKGQ